MARKRFVEHYFPNWGGVQAQQKWLPVQFMDDSRASHRQKPNLRMTKLDTAIVVRPDGPYLVTEDDELFFSDLDVRTRHESTRQCEMGVAYEAFDYMTASLDSLFSANELARVSEEYGGSGANCKSKGSDGQSIFSEQWGCYTRWNRPVAPPEPASSEPLPEFDSAMFFSNGVEAI